MIHLVPSDLSLHLIRPSDGGGADTLHSAINRFVIAMAGHPEIQEKAQEEIARVVGTDRLPAIQECVIKDPTSLGQLYFLSG